MYCDFFEGLLEMLAALILAVLYYKVSHEPSGPDLTQNTCFELLRTNYAESYCLLFMLFATSRPKADVCF